MRPKKTVLCVDDNEQALSVRKFLLETRGYRVLTAITAEQALEKFREGGIDLVLSDVVMPQMDGNELVRRMKEISSDVPMLLISGTVKAYERASAADGFLLKGQCSPQETLEKIRVMLIRKRGPKKQVRFAGEAFATNVPVPPLHTGASASVLQVPAVVAKQPVSAHGLAS